MNEDKLNKVIRDLEKLTKTKNCPFVCFDALELLKEQQKAIEDAYHDGYSVGYDAKKAEIEEEYGVLQEDGSDLKATVAIIATTTTQTNAQNSALDVR